jgi:hypothetical protein
MSVELSEEPSDSRVCTGCNTEKSLSDFPSGRTRCKKCTNAEANVRHKKRQEQRELQILSDASLQKTCNVCNTLKYLSDFPRGGGRKCQKCINAAQQERKRKRIDGLAFYHPDGSLIHKTCRRCNISKPLTAFSPLNHSCRKCNNERVSIQNQESYDYRSRRNKQLRREFGITLEEYEQMLFKQGGVCAVCGAEEEVIDARRGKKRCLAVDHDHQTGQVRELLCHTCNRFLGYKENYPERNKKLDEYIQKHRKLTT